MIGVILMVVVTVILAAVIAAFVFGMGTSAQKGKVVAATAQISGDNLIVTYQGGPNHGDLLRRRLLYQQWWMVQERGWTRWRHSQTQ